MKIYCSRNLNISCNIFFPEIRAIGLLSCQWSISFCMVWKLREGSRVADCLPTKTCATFPTVSSFSGYLLLQKAVHYPGHPDEACVHVFDCLWWLLQLLFVNQLFRWEASCLVCLGTCTPRFWSTHGAPGCRANPCIMNDMAETNSLLQLYLLFGSLSDMRMKNRQVPAPKILPAPSSVLQPTLAQF